MQVELSILFNHDVKRIYMKSTDAKSHLKNVIFNDHSLEVLDNIYEISITPNRVIFVRSDPGFRGGAISVPFEKEACRVSNIDAYDWNGKHLWNIADIVGDIKHLFFGGCVMTKKQFVNARFAEYSVDLSKVPENHEFYNACTDGRRYIIDMDTLEVIMILPNK